MRWRLRMAIVAEARGFRQEARRQAEREERAWLADFIHRGKRAAHLLTKARILVKSGRVGGRRGMERQPDRRGAGHQHPDDRSATRRRLVEEGFEAVLTRKHNPKSAPRRIFDGAVKPSRSLWAWLDRPRPARPDGRCVFWRRKSSSCRSSGASVTTRSGGRSPDRKPQWVIAAGQRRLRRQHGRRAGRLPEAARSQAPPRMPR